MSSVWLYVGTTVSISDILVLDNLQFPYPLQTDPIIFYPRPASFSIAFDVLVLSGEEFVLEFDTITLLVSSYVHIHTLITQ